ncbi:MAG: TPM domain-containing protein [Nitrososphaera sp.]|uniref:TPM domain-containing protein n=1 Tax=Nitrososphaera sp. TaxID=1971748 RepID=UPI00317A742B
MALRLALFSILFLVVAASAFSPAFSQRGSRPAYIYDYAGIISSSQEDAIDTYLRGLDDATTNEIVIYTIPSFVGHGIKKDGVEIQDRDFLANYIYNEVTLDGIKGIGKAGKDNGVLVLFSLERDAGGGSMRIEVGRGLEGDITDGTAGQILDSYLVPARDEYEQSGATSQFDDAFLNTVYALAGQMGYTGEGQPIDGGDFVEDPFDENDAIFIAVMFAIFIGIAVLQLKYGRRRRRFYGGYYGGWGGGGGGGGGFGGGGGGSGGGGAGR